MNTQNRKQFVVVDDSVNIPVILEHLLKIHNMEGDLEYFENPEEALQHLQKKHYDLLFLDIDMPQMTGLELLNRLDNPPYTVILTAYPLQYAEESYAFLDKGLIDYISKSSLFEKFGRVKERFCSRSMSNIPMKNNENELVILVTEHPDKMVKLSISEILYFEQKEEYTYIITPVSYPQQYRVRQKIADIEKWLPRNCSFAISKDILVMLNRIVSMKKEWINMGIDPHGKDILLKVVTRKRSDLIHILKKKKKNE